MPALRSDCPPRDRRGRTSRDLTGTILLSLWAVCLATVLALHAFPYNPDLSLGTAGAWRAFAGSWGWRTHISNAIANAALFLPLGCLGMLAVPIRNRPVRAAVVAGLGFLVAFGGQAAQIYIPQRDASLVDVVWNMAGLAPGLVIGLLPWRTALARWGVTRQVRSLPLLIAGCWLAYRTAPWIPTLDISVFKENLKPLLLAPALDVWAVYASFCGWLTAGFLLREASHLGRLDRALPALFAATVLAEVSILYSGGVTASQLLGGVLAVLAWFAALRGRQGRIAAAAVALVLLVRIVGESIWPFVFTTMPVRDFQWLPFYGILGGSRWTNVLAMLEKLFVYSSVVYALWVLGRSWALAAVAGGAVLFAIEWMQQYQPGRVPEITDPLIVVLVGVLGWALTARESFGGKDCG